MNLLNDPNFLKEHHISKWGYTEISEALTFNEFDSWVNKDKHLPLNYLAGDRKLKRQDLKLFYPNFNSALTFLFTYNEGRTLLNKFYCKENNNGLKIASYTFGFEGEDYHFFLKEKLEKVGLELQKNIPELEFKLAMDVHPVLDRDLAYRSGLGWFGKNSMLINREIGSFFIIGSILFNQKLNFEQKRIETDHCGQCTRCLDACPTNAIDPITRTIIAKDCISTFTIEEFKLDANPSEKMNLSSGYIFGCDICQEICPWNNREKLKASLGEINQFEKNQTEIIQFFLTEKVEDVISKLEKMSNKEYINKFKMTSFERSGKKGILKNLYFYLKNKKM